ncbi:Protein-lysine N-methyltransferase efm4 [Lecanicillium sp. MT-2017a]|nr:Protein-lysine N-methyltransferase efm4 [Lecanicillium sp. MT-2017a]
MSKPTHLEPSELGTKEYWDSLYTNEITNNKANPDDKGTVWFDDSDAEAKMLSYLSRLSDSPSDSDSESDSSQTPSQTAPSLSKSSTSILDLGCGNGSILHALRSSGWTGPLMGVDYSAHSITLARQISAAAAASDEHDNAISFLEWDVLNGSLESVAPPPSSGSERKTWDVVLDKGTFDAISLSEETDAQGRRICEGYKGRVLRLLSRGGLFLITSCNWTEEELRGWFVGGETEGELGALEEVGRVKYRTFSFGGVKGQTISTLCFRKV